MKIISSLVTAVVLLTGCISTKEVARRRESELQERVRFQAAVAEERRRLKAEIEESRKIREPFLIRGLSSGDARQVWGPPNRVNESVGSLGRHQQWVYWGLATDPIDGVIYHVSNGGWLPGEALYLYFDNGELTAWQSSK